MPRGFCHWLTPLANATVGVLTSASLAIHAVGRGLTQAMDTLTNRLLWITSARCRCGHAGP